MSAAIVHPSRRVSCRILMMSTVVTAVAAAAVLAVGTQDARLLRLGLVAALWAALLGAFAAAQMRREARSSVDHADHLRSTYQLELEREVTARREHALTVERELREQAERTQRREIVELRAEIAAMRANLERLGGASLVERVTLRAPAARGRTGTSFGPGLAPVSNAGVSNGESSHEQGRHGERTPAMQPQGQRTVDDLIAAHGGTAPTPRRRRNYA